MSLKILVFAPHEGDHIYPWLRAFENSHYLTLVTLHPNKPRSEKVTYVNLTRWTKTRFDFFLNIPAFIKLVNKLKPDIIHVHYLSSYGLIAALLPRRRTKILSIWGSDFNKYFSNSLMGRLCRWAIQKYDIINSPSIDIAQKLVQWGYPSSRIETFQYGIDYSELRRRVPDKSKPVQFLSPRDWAPLYRIEKIIESFAVYVGEDRRAHLHLTGRGSSKRQAELQALIDKLGIRQNVTIHGYSPWEQYVNFLSSCDVLVSIPTMDGMPLSLLEANYIGLYPIVSKVPANEEWLAGGYASFVSGEDTNEIAAAMEVASQACHNEVELEKNRQKIFSTGDRKKNMAKLESIYLSLAQQRLSFLKQSEDLK